MISTPRRPATCLRVIAFDRQARASMNLTARRGFIVVLWMMVGECSMRSGALPGSIDDVARAFDTASAFVDGGNVTGNECLITDIGMPIMGSALPAGVGRGILVQRALRQLHVASRRF